MAQAIINFIKVVYGLVEFENKDTTQYGNNIIAAWYLPGYPTLEELEEKYNDSEILDFYNQQKDV